MNCCREYGRRLGSLVSIAISGGAADSGLPFFIAIAALIRARILLSEREPASRTPLALWDWATQRDCASCGEPVLCLSSID